jgi:hypothetical protein
VILVLNREEFKGQAGAVWVTVVIVGSLAVANGAALIFGQPSAMDTGGAVAPDYSRIFSTSMRWDMKIVAIGSVVVYLTLLGGIAVYEPGGMILALVCGALMGWRAVDCVRAFKTA